MAAPRLGRCVTIYLSGRAVDADLLAQQPRVPDCIAGRAGGLAVAVADGGRTATVDLAAPSVQLTAVECRRAAALLFAAAAAIECPGDELTPREAEVLGMLAKGCTIQDVAEHLGIKWFTVNDHIKAVHRKLGINSRGEAGAMAVRLGLA